MTLNVCCPSYLVLSTVDACMWRKNWKRDFSYSYVIFSFLMYYNYIY